MAKNWAICVGINHYDNMPTLQYAQRDAELMRDYFLNDAGFEKVYLFTDNSPEINDAGKPFNSQPTYGTLKRFLRVRFNKEFLSAGDNFWFFYSGHGMRFSDRDYLMPTDADPHPDGVEDTAIPLYLVTERLRRCGADNVILFLDACRSQESSKGLGIGEEKQKGVITIASCSPNEKSYEIEDERIKKGAFTYALLESLRIQGESNCATVERLYNRLLYRIPDINRQFRKPRQTPYAIVEPATKYNLILLEKQANLSDIATLKNDAYQAEVEKNIELAKQLWIRVNIAASGSDMEAINAISRLNNSINYSKSENKENNSSSNDPGKKSSLPKVAKKLIKTFPTIQDFVSRSFLFIFTGILGAFLATITVSILEKNKNIEYSTLENLLKQKKWKEADWETFNIMLKVTNLEKEGGLNTESIKKFSCSNLRIIDLLWQKYSDDKLGFSAQSRIYQSLAGTKEYDDESWKNFGDKVGWREAGKWLSYSDSRLFNISQPEQGRFPVTRYWQGKFYVNDIFLRAETCKF
ncbi:MAG: hypothetical protein F6K25_06480 [Okeania sp. SIO2G4]|uniref:GUN4 domain-containing protein n=1 Tax=unclassified Okeania TaxID=2634635 RepID=UPI0013BBA35B|nr:MULTISPECIES: GUN4 domain-containing protein [unclassified Okeania]NEP04191.1 hypothetical protein [Okeania sp. SIO4D6]NEP70452.1 hypothetical protein [Okeania sp. SIO2G5]NEP92654.1 hypothetical protein [Okeania sp. SIO2F5]NEQ90389.1 hypothetical protein [Okeania sp. SIO2G4]